jgi:hypothetical protein
MNRAACLLCSAKNICFCQPCHPQRRDMAEYGVALHLRLDGPGVAGTGRIKVG